MSTLRDVAKKAGVSISTASRVVNGYEHVSDAVRMKVMKAIDELGYQPNLLAQRLVRGKETKQIGLLVHDVGNPFFAEIARAVEHIAYQNDYTVILCNSSEGKQTSKYLDMFMQRQVDGVAIATGELETNDISRLEHLLERNVPVVMCRERRWACNTAMEHLISQIGIIELDYYTGAKIATEYLISLGHKRIALLFSLTDADLDKDPRIIGFREVLDKHGLEFDKDLIVTNLGFTKASGARGTLELLARKQDFSAIIAYNDLLAIGALAASREEGLRVPQDISIMGFDNIEDSQYTYPLLTTVNVSKSEQGELMAEYLLASGNEENKQIYKRFSAELVVRQSTAVRNLNSYKT